MEAKCRTTVALALPLVALLVVVRSGRGSGRGIGLVMGQQPDLLSEAIDTARLSCQAVRVFANLSLETRAVRFPGISKVRDFGIEIVVTTEHAVHDHLLLLLVLRLLLDHLLQLCDFRGESRQTRACVERATVTHAFVSRTE